MKYCLKFVISISPYFKKKWSANSIAKVRDSCRTEPSNGIYIGDFMS